MMASLLSSGMNRVGLDEYLGVGFFFFPFNQLWRAAKDEIWIRKAWGSGIGGDMF